MTERGRKLLLIDIALVLGAAIATMMFYAGRVGTDRLAVQLVRLGLTIALCWGVYRGSRAARYIMATLLSLGFGLAVTGLPAVLRTGDAAGVVFVAALAVVYCFVASNLFWSKSIVAFQQSQREKRSATT